MGCSTSNPVPVPEPVNICNPNGDDVGDIYDVPNSCFFTTEVGKFCPGTGLPDQRCPGEAQGDGEWANIGSGAGCGVCSSCKGIEQGVGNGLCGFGTGSCSWAGVRQRCRRVATNGNPLACCRRDRGVIGNLFCFDDNSGHRTCPNQYRGFGQTACIGQMQGYCSDDTEEVYTAKWADVPGKDCNRFVAENAGNREFYKPVVEDMVERYLITENHPITSPQSDGPAHDPFIDRIVEICRENPGACDDILQQKCQSVQRDDLSTNVNLANLCGCFMQDIEYAEFSQFGIERICDPVCTIGSSVKPWDSTTSDPAQFQKCNQSICVIDDITLNILSQSVTGDITFSQACSSCSADGSGSCRCYITDTVIQAVDSQIGDINFDQQCGGAPICFKKATVAGAPPIQVDCNTGKEIGTAGGENTGGFNFLWIILIVLIVILLLIIIIAIAGRRESGEIIIPAQRQTVGLIPSSSYQPQQSLIGRRGSNVQLL